MLSIETILGIICTEELEEREPREPITNKNDNFRMKYNLELIEDENGNLYWIE